MPYHIDEENSELLFDVTENDKLVIKVKSGTGGGGGTGSDIYVIKRDEPTSPSDNNVFSSLRTLDEIIEKSDELEKKVLHKDKPDITNFLLYLVGGAEFGQYASGISGGKISPDGAAELLTLLLRGALTIGDYEAGKSGARIDKQGVADLLSILVRNGMESANFSTGALGAGFCLKKDENGDSYLEVDRMLVRKVATFIQLLIQQIKHVGGQIILTPASMSCAKVEDMGDYYRCYFENTDGEKTIEQEFVVGDLARAQTFNVKEGVNENITNTYYWRAVVGTGDNYIDLSKTDCDAGSTEPKAGDDIVQLGNKSDATRQAAIILSAYGNDAPYFKLYRGINSYSLDGKEFVSFSRSEVMIIADAIKFSSGESVKDYIDNAVGEVNTKVDDAISDLSENISFVNQLSKDLEAVKNQIDGAIETWFYEPVPTLSNEPAVNWTTNEDKNVHLGDLYYDGNGKAYRFQMSGTSYVWQVITDSDITKALADAKKAQDTADGKRRVFVTTPSNASVYDIGDLWVNATYGSYKNDLLRCKTSKQANAQFSIEHWELATRYTDDTKANQAIEDAANAKAAADNAQTDANKAKERLDSWASDGSISPTEKQSLKEEISRIDADKTQVSNGYAKYNLGTPTNYNNAHTAYRAVLVTLTASSPETITIPSDFATKQTAYYTQRTNALTAISNAARDYAETISNDLASYKKTVSSQFEQTNNSITAAVTSSKEYTNTKVGEVNTSLTEYKKEVTSKFSVLEGEISSKVSSTEITTLKTEILNTAASDATNKANKAKQDAITTAGQNADKKYATITTVSSMQTSITQLSNSLSLKAEKSEVTAVQNNLNQTNNNLSALTTRVSKAEVALEPDNIWIGISSRVTTTGKLNNIVPDSCFDDTNYSLLYSGGQRIQKDSAPSGCPTNYCMKSTASIVYANNGVSVALGEKYYISAVVNASSANYEVLVGLMLKSNTGSYSYLPIEGVAAKTSGWQTISGYVTIPNNILDARIYFKINGSSSLGTAYFTKVYAYKVDESVNQNYALLTSNEKRLTTFNNVANQRNTLYKTSGLKKGDIVTISFEYEASNLIWNTTENSYFRIQFDDKFGWTSYNIPNLKSNGTGKIITPPLTLGGSDTNIKDSNIEMVFYYISSVLQDNKPIGYFRVWNLKVEKGERATPWSAAPSDYSTTEEIKAGMQITDKGFNFFGQEFNFSGRISVGDLDPTIIEDGYLRASLINADTLVVKTLNASNTDGVSTLVNKDGMKMTQGSNVLFKLTSNKATVGTTRYYAQMDLTTVYPDGSTLQGTLTPESLFLRGKTKSTDKTLKTTLMYNGLMIYDENGTGLTVNTKGIQLTYCGKTQGGGDVCAVVHYAKCIFSAYITAQGRISYNIGGSIPNSSGTPIEFSVTRTGAGRYKVTHNINDLRYMGQITALSNGNLTVGIFENRNSTSFDYSTISLNGSGWYAQDCGVYLSIYYESPMLFTF